MRKKEGPMRFNEKEEKDLLGKRRDKLEIIEDLLSAADKQYGVNKTFLVYQTNLNFNRLENFLPYLLDRGLIERVNEQGQKFVTTNKGREFLRQLNSMKKLL
jgi:predicted transcriptional regulator